MSLLSYQYHIRELYDTITHTVEELIDRYRHDMIRINQETKLTTDLSLNGLMPNFVPEFGIYQSVLSQLITVFV